MPRRIIAASPLSPPGCVRAFSAGSWAARCDTGASATVPRTFSSGVHFGASDAANSADCPPWEWPAMTTLRPRRLSSLRAARTMSSIE